MRSNKFALVLVAIVLLAMLLWVFLGQQGFKYETIVGQGYLSGDQGLQAQFHSLRISGVWLSDSEKPESFTLQDRVLSAKTASNWFFGYEMNFDPDQSDDGFPNLCVTQQPFTIDTQTEPKHYSWLVDKGLVTLSNGTIVKKYYQFEMWRYRLEWSVNIWLSGPEEEAWDRAWHMGVGWEPDYGGTEIWIKLTPKRFVYFKDNPDEVYFAPAYIGLEDYVIASIDKDGRLIENDVDMLGRIDLIPKAEGEALGIYYSRGGGDAISNETILRYRGIELDPKIFRDEYWIHMDLLTFKPWNAVEFWTKAHSWKYPSVNLKFIVYVFVVGKWTVYFRVDEVPQLRPHKPIITINDPWSWLTGWFSNPLNQLWLFFIIIVIVILVVTILNPGLWAAVIASFNRKK